MLTGRHWSAGTARPGGERNVKRERMFIVLKKLTILNNNYLTRIYRPEGVDQVQHGERHGEQAQQDVGNGQIGNQNVSCGQLYLASNNYQC